MHACSAACSPGSWWSKVLAERRLRRRHRHKRPDQRRSRLSGRRRSFPRYCCRAMPGMIDDARPRQRRGARLPQNNAGGIRPSGLMAEDRDKLPADTGAVGEVDAFVRKLAAMPASNRVVEGG